MSFNRISCLARLKGEFKKKYSCLICLFCFTVNQIGFGKTTLSFLKLQYLYRQNRYDACHIKLTIISFEKLAK